MMASNGGRAALDGKRDAARRTRPELPFRGSPVRWAVRAVSLSQLSLSLLALWARGAEHAETGGFRRSFIDRNRIAKITDRCFHDKSR